MFFVPLGHVAICRPSKANKTPETYKDKLSRLGVWVLDLIGTSVVAVQDQELRISHMMQGMGCNVLLFLIWGKLLAWC